MPANDIDRPAADLTRRISLLATSTLANALDNAGLHNNVRSPLASALPDQRSR